MRVTISPDGIAWLIGSNETTYGWGAFDRFSETRRLLVFWRGTESPRYVPKRVLSSEQLAALRRVVASRLRPLHPRAAPGGFAVEATGTKG